MEKLSSLTQKSLEKFSLVIITSHEELARSLLPEVQLACYTPDEKGESLTIKITNRPLTLIEEEKLCEWSTLANLFLIRDPFRKHMLVSVDAGMGKTITVQKLEKTPSSIDHYHWKILIYLDQILPERTENANLTDFIIRTYANKYRAEHNQELPIWIRTALTIDIQYGNVLLLLDGGDQIEQEAINSEQSKSILHQLVTYPHVIFLTRPDQSLLNFPADNYLALLSFNKEQISDYFLQAFPTILIIIPSQLCC